MTSLDRILQSGKVTSFGRATAANIARFQKTNAVELSDEFRAYLHRCNGMSTSFDFEDVKEAGMHMALADINQIHGINNGFDHADMTLMAQHMDEHVKKLMLFAHAIGIGGDCCTFVELIQGRYRGQIMYTDGEMYPGYFREARTDWSEPVDDLVEQFIDDGFSCPSPRISVPCSTCMPRWCDERDRAMSHRGRGVPDGGTPVSHGRVPASRR